MDLTMVASGVIGFLAPALPYLLKASEKVAEGAATKLGVEAWNLAQRLWSKLQPKMESKLTARAAAEDAANHPNDDDARAALRRQIKLLLEAEPDLANELNEILAAAKAAGVTTTTVIVSGERAVGVGRDVTGGRIITGDQSKPDTQ
jgi:hypothetical protein